jgi:surfeit locus 1 family protein
MKRILATVTVLAACAVLVSLGMWQLQRLDWKRGLLAQIETQAHIDATKVDLASQIGDTANNLNRGYLRGRYARGMDVHIGPQLRGGEIGYWTISPLILAGGDQVLVNRGWSTEKNAPPPAGPVRVIGTLRMADGTGKPIAGNVRAWHKLNVTGIAKALELQRVAPLALFAEVSEPPENALAPVPALSNMRNEHRQYAIFWFTMAGVLFAGFVVFSLRGRR